MTISAINTEFQPIMVDCETLGLSPNENPIIQLAMVSFDAKTFQPIEEFEIFLPLEEQLQSGLKADQSTVDWWAKQHPKVVQHIADGLAQAPRIDEALQTTYHWVNKQVCDHAQRTGNNNTKSVFWAKPVGFDFPFVDGLFRRHQQISPFHYQQVVDMKTHILAQLKSVFFYTYKYELPEGAAQDMYWLFNDWAKKQNKDRAEDAHNATADCHYQLEWLAWTKMHLSNILAYYDKELTVKSYLGKI